MCVDPCDLWPSISPTVPCLWNSGYSDSLLYFFLPLAFCKDAPLLCRLWLALTLWGFFFWLWPSNKPSDSDINQATNTSQSQEHRQGFFFFSPTFLVLLGQRKQPAILQPAEELTLRTGSSFLTLRIFVVLFRQNKHLIPEMIIMLFRNTTIFFYVWLFFGKKKIKWLWQKTVSRINNAKKHHLKTWIKSLQR